MAAILSRPQCVNSIVSPVTMRPPSDTFSVHPMANSPYVKISDWPFRLSDWCSPEVRDDHQGSRASAVTDNIYPSDTSGWLQLGHSIDLWVIPGTINSLAPGRFNEILDKYFKIILYWLMTEVSLIKLPSVKCCKTSLMISQHWLG